MKNNSNIIDINLIKLRKLISDEEYRQKEILRRKQYLYDYDYKKFLMEVDLKLEDNTTQ